MGMASLWIKSRLEASIQHEYNRTLDILRKQRDIRVSYLIEAFRVLAKRANLPKGRSPLELAPQIESALADIQLLGTQEQIKAAMHFAKAEASHQLISMDDLLKTFRAELRQELALPPIDEPIWNLRYSEEHRSIPPIQEQQSSGKHDAGS
jgi:hypothetical protein